MKYARIVNNTAVDVRIDKPDGCFTDEIVAQFVQVPNTVQDGWSNSTGTWVAPVIVAPVIITPIIIPPKLSPIQFKMCFTSQERIAIEALKATDPIITDAYMILDDQRLTEVDLSLASNIVLIDYLATKVPLLTPARVTEIKSGKLL